MTWGASAWGDKPLGWVPVSAGGSATVIPTGVTATVGVGTPVATGAALALPAGVSATATVGTPTATGEALALPAGVTATASVGTPVAVTGGAAIALPAGVTAYASVGSLIATGAAWCMPAGVQATASVGTPIAVVGGVTGVYPLAATVLAGITYGPTGADYTGTLTWPTVESIAAQVRTELAAELLRLNDLAKVHGLIAGTDLIVTPTARTAGDVVQAIGTAGDTVTVSRAP